LRKKGEKKIKKNSWIFLRYSSSRNLHVFPDSFARRCIEIRTSSLWFSRIFVWAYSLRNTAQCTISYPHLNAYPRGTFPTVRRARPRYYSLPFFFPFSLMWSGAAVIGNNPGEPHWNSSGVLTTSVFRFYFSKVTLPVTLLCWRNKIEAAQQKKLLSKAKERPETRNFLLHNLYVFIVRANNLFVSKFCTLTS